MVEAEGYRLWADRWSFSFLVLSDGGKVEASKVPSNSAGFPELLDDEFEGGLTTHSWIFGLFFDLGKTGRWFS